MSTTEPRLIRVGTWLQKCDSSGVVTAMALVVSRSGDDVEVGTADVGGTLTDRRKVTLSDLFEDGYEPVRS